MTVASFLRRVPLFDCLEDRELEALAQLTYARTFDKGQLIILADEPGDTLFIVRRGQVKVSLTHASGKEFILSLLGEGEFFGELALLDERPRSASVVAIEETELLMLRRPDFLQLLGRTPAIAIALLQELAARLRRTDEQVGGLALLDVHNRVARTLLRLAAHRGEESQEGLVIRQRLTHQQLANMSGTTRETVTRVLKQLERDGYIRVSDRHLVVLKGGSEALAEDGLGSAGLEGE